MQQRREHTSCHGGRSPELAPPPAPHVGLYIRPECLRSSIATGAMAIAKPGDSAHGADCDHSGNATCRSCHSRADQLHVGIDLDARSRFGGSARAGLRDRLGTRNGAGESDCGVFSAPETPRPASRALSLPYRRRPPRRRYLAAAAAAQFAPSTTTNGAASSPLLVIRPSWRRRPPRRVIAARAADALSMSTNGVLTPQEGAADGRRARDGDAPPLGPRPPSPPPVGGSRAIEPANRVVQRLVVTDESSSRCQGRLTTPRRCRCCTSRAPRGYTRCGLANRTIRSAWSGGAQSRRRPA